MPSSKSSQNNLNELTPYNRHIRAYFKAHPLKKPSTQAAVKARMRKAAAAWRAKK